jgi:hypothetical protein
MVIGDLNSYAMEDPVAAIKVGPDDVAGTGDDYTNLIAKYQGKFAYSYTFDGQAGYLDHALATPSLTGQVTGAADWHINSDEPDLLDYDTTFKSPTQDTFYEPNAYRSSDHDPVRVGLDLNAPPTIAVAGGGSCGPGAGGTVLVTVGDLQTPAADLALVAVSTSNPTLVPLGNVELGGSGANRTIAISATPRVSGTSVIGFTLDDGVNTTSFTITVKVGTDLADTLTGTAGACSSASRAMTPCPAWAMATCCVAATATTRSPVATASIRSRASGATTRSPAAPVTTSSGAARATIR